MMLPLLLACTEPSTGDRPGGLLPPIERIDELDDAIEVWHDGPEEREFGWRVVSGSDVDHDGHLEWVVSAPVLELFSNDWDRDDAIVRFFEGAGSVVVERSPRQGKGSVTDHGLSLVAGEDIDGDGFPDAAYTTVNNTWGVELRVVHGLENGTDTRIRDWVHDNGNPYPGLGSILFGHTGTAPFLIAGTSGAQVAVVDDLVFGEANPASIFSSVVREAPGGVHVGEFAATEKKADGSRGWVYAARCFPGYGESCDRPVGPFLCDGDPDISVHDDCTPLGDSTTTDVGYTHAAGDLDGDGLDEVVSSHNAGNGADGFVRVYRSDGSELAVIRGTRGAMFGLNPTFVRDGHGDPWLLIGQLNGSGSDPGTVWAFRGERVVGQLRDEDATKVFQAGFGRLGQAVATYQETPDHPYYLLLSAGAGVVYMVPFDDP